MTDKLLTGRNEDAGLAVSLESVVAAALVPLVGAAELALGVGVAVGRPVASVQRSAGDAVAPESFVAHTNGFEGVVVEDAGGVRSADVVQVARQLLLFLLRKLLRKRLDRRHFRALESVALVAGVALANVSFRRTRRADALGVRMANVDLIARHCGSNENVLMDRGP
jgi:hypothetical protein